LFAYKNESNNNAGNEKTLHNCNLARKHPFKLPTQLSNSTDYNQ